MKLDIYLTPFANRFGMLRDKFGTSWMLLDEAEAAASQGSGGWRPMDRMIHDGGAGGHLAVWADFEWPPPV